MSNETPPAPDAADAADDSMTVKYGLGWRDAATGEIDSITEDGPTTEGYPVFACELPPVIAYEIGWALSMYGKTLHEYATEATNGEAKLAAEKKRDISLSLASSFRDAGIRGVKLETGEDLAPYDTSENFAEEGDSDGGEA
jgi:hypothetical protein